jgi:hypothetical protein
MKNGIIGILSILVIILVAFLVSPYLVTHTSTAQQTDMPPGMVMKSFYIGPLSVIASSSGMNSDMAGMDMKANAPVASTTLIVPTGLLASTTAPIPTISFILNKDTLDGWDLHVTTTNFTWTPENINKAPIADQGHAHLYIDGALTVLLGPWYHINGVLLLPGRHVITVSLNANDHSVFSVNGNNVEDTETLEVSPI